MDRGYVKLWRKTLDSGLLQSPAALQLFTWLLLTASRTPRKMTVNGAVVELQPGEAVFTRVRAANELGITEKQARLALDKLKAMQIVATRGANRYTVVSIINWNSYQQSGAANGPTDGPCMGLEGAANGPTDEVASSNINKNEELRILNTPPHTPPKGEGAGENAISSSPENENPENQEKPEEAEKPEKPASKKTHPYTKEFEDFWKVYPRKVGKDAAFRAFRNKKPLLPSIPLLCAIIERQAHTEQWQRDGGRFIPHPATWLNQGRWQDEIQTEKGWTEKPANW